MLNQIVRYAALLLAALVLTFSGVGCSSSQAFYEEDIEWMLPAESNQSQVVEAPGLGACDALGYEIFTRHDIHLARRGAHQLRHVVQHRVAGLMAVGLIEVLEVIQVEHEHGQGLVVAAAAEQFVSEARPEIADVVDGRQLVHERQLAIHVGPCHLKERSILRNRRRHIMTMRIDNFYHNIFKSIYFRRELLLP